VLIRSNYAQPEVALRIALRQAGTGAEEIGRLELALLDESKGLASAVGHRFHRFGELRLDFEIVPVDGRVVGEAE